jgi:transcriptional regulator with XRE-family HTH domain
VSATSQETVVPSRIHSVRDWVIVFYRRLPHIMNMRILNRAMRDRQIAGDFDTVLGLADLIGVSRSTVSRFFSGRNTSLGATLKILDALNLTFDQVFMEISPVLLARLQADGTAHCRNGALHITSEILTWPEANEICEHFGTPALAAAAIHGALTDGSHDRP